MKKLLSLLFAVFLCCGLLACSLSPVNYEVHALALAAEPISVGYGDAMQEDYQSFLDKLDLFAARLTAAVYAVDDKESNLCISPVSVYMALALAIECGSGETREEMLSAVGVTYEEVKSFTGQLYALANREYEYTDAFLELANSLWADDEVLLAESGVHSLANDYHCDLFRVDFATDEGERAIASYIKDKTHGLIDGAIDLPPETLITLINTFYLKDSWNIDAINLDLTKSLYDFQNANGSTATTPLLMGYYFAGRAYEGEGYTSFYMSTDRGFRISFILPEDGYTLDEVFTAENLYTIGNVTDYGYKDDANMLLHYTRALFPAFEASSSVNIASMLQNDFGIRAAFDFAEADFSGISDTTPLALGSVLHKCALRVDKKGIEGAAATAVDGGGSPGPSDYTKVYHDFVVDRAFGFVLIDNYGTVLFSGAVNTLK